MLRVKGCRRDEMDKVKTLINAILSELHLPVSLTERGDKCINSLADAYWDHDVAYYQNQSFSLSLSLFLVDILQMKFERTEQCGK